MSANNYNKGTFNELGLALQLSLSNTFPTHYKNDDKSPERTFETIKMELGETTSSLMFYRCGETAKEIKNCLVNDNLLANTIDIAEIAWTNSPNKGDHLQFTGIDDPNSDADLIIRTLANTYVGISVKYGTSKDGTLRSPSLVVIGNILSIDNINRPLEDHDTYMETLGFVGSKDERKDQYKKMKGSPLAQEAEASMLKVKRTIVAQINDRLKVKSSDELKAFSSDLISPTTVFPHYRVQTIERKDSFDNKIYDIKKETDKKLSAYDLLYVKDSEGHTTYSTVYGKKNSSLDEESIIKLSAKNKSSPMKGLDGHVTSPMLNRKKKNILYVFDMDHTLFYYEGDVAYTLVLDKAGDEVCRLSHEDLKTYMFDDGHRLDYREFQDSKLFHDSCRPISNVVEKMLKLREKRNDVIIMTARTQFNDGDLFGQALRNHGIDFTDIPVFYTGDIPNIKSQSDGKRIQFNSLIANNNYDEIHFYDDSENNMKEFMNLSLSHPNIVFKGYHVKFNEKTKLASMKRYKND